MTPSSPPPSSTGGTSWIYGCAVWFIAAAPVVGGALLGAFVGGLSSIPSGVFVLALVGAALGLVLGIISYRYGRRVLHEAAAYTLKQHRGSAEGGGRAIHEGTTEEESTS